MRFLFFLSKTWKPSNWLQRRVKPKVWLIAVTTISLSDDVFRLLPTKIKLYYLLMIILGRWRGIIRDVPSSALWPAKQQRPAGGGRRSLLRRSSQSSVCKRRREKERENSEDSRSSFIWSNTPFYTHVCHMSILPLSSTGLNVGVRHHFWLDLICLIKSHRDWRPLAIKAHRLGTGLESGLSGD